MMHRGFQKIRSLCICAAVAMTSFGAQIPARAADSSVAINETNFPDAYFRNFVSENFDTDENGVLSATEMTAVTEIDFGNPNSGCGITSLKGIENFTALTKLEARWNDISSIDLSKNTALTQVDLYENALTELDLSNNTNLTNLDVSHNKLKDLDLSKNIALKQLDCGSNQLTELDLSKNTAIYSLICSYNKLSDLDISNNLQLSNLWINGNQISSLNVSKHEKLGYLYCENCGLSALDVSKNTHLSFLCCENNKITELNLENSPYLSVLHCEDNALTSLDVSKNTSLANLCFDNNKITSIDISKNTALTMLKCAHNELETLDLTKNTKIGSLNCGYNYFSEVDVSSCVSALKNNMSNVSGTIDENNILHVTSRTKTTTTPISDCTVTVSDVVYSGSAQTPSVTVKNGTSYLTKGTDYTVAYKNNTNAGTGTVTITGIGKYSGTTTADFTIKQRSISLASTSTIPEQAYTGEEITPAITLKDGTKTLTEGTDYTLVYENNVGPGTAYVRIYGAGNYTGSFHVNFVIRNRDIADATVNIYNQTYTGKEIQTTITVKDGTTGLTENVDYTVEYANNINAGTATVTLTGKGNYSGTKDVEFTIKPRSVTQTTVSAIEDQAYTGSAIKPEVTVTYEGVTLKKGTDYTTSYSNNTAAGTAKVSITGMGNYTGTTNKSFNIIGNDISQANIAAIDTQTYTGSAITPAVTVKFGTTTLKQGTDYSVAYSNNVKVGKATVTITGKGNFSGTKTATFSIKRRSIVDATMTQVKARVYTGIGITPAVVVNVGGKKLVKDTDYVIDYIQNVNVGTATIRVMGCGNYVGTVKKTFKILPKGTAVRELTPNVNSFLVRWDKQDTSMKTFHITGYQIQYSTSSTFAANKKVLTVNGYGKTSAKVTGLRRSTTYYLRVRTYRKLNSGNYFSTWSATRMIRTK